MASRESDDRKHGTQDSPGADTGHDGRVVRSSSHPPDAQTSPPGSDGSGLRALPTESDAEAREARDKRSTPAQRLRRRKQLGGAVIRLERHKRNTPAARPSRLPRGAEVRDAAQGGPRAEHAADEVTRRASVRAIRAHGVEPSSTQASPIRPTPAAPMAPPSLGSTSSRRGAVLPVVLAALALAAWLALR